MQNVPLAFLGAISVFCTVELADSISCLLQVSKELSTQQYNFVNFELVILAKHGRPFDLFLPDFAPGQIQISHLRHFNNAKKLFVQILSKLYSVAQTSQIDVLIEPETEPELFGLLKQIGRMEGKRLSPNNSKTASSPSFYIFWPVNNTTPQQLRSLLRSSGSSSSWSCECCLGISSHIFFVLPQDHKDNVSTICPMYQYYTLKDTGNFVLSPVSVDVLGNVMMTRTDFGGMIIKATAVAIPGVVFVDSNSTVSQHQGPRIHNPRLRMSSGYLGSAGNGNDNIFDKLESMGTNEPVLDNLQQSLNFRLRIIPASIWLQLPPINGTWLGIGKLLLNGSADMSIDLSTFVPFRAFYFTLLMPVFLDRLNVYFRQPPASTVRNIFAQPFSNYLWVAIASQFALGLAFMTLIKYFVRRYPKYCELRLIEMEKNVDEAPVLASNYVLWLTATMTLQGWHTTPKKTWLRIIFFIGSATGLVLYTAYAGNLVSFFASEVNPIQNLQQFSESELPLYADTASPTMRQIFNESFNIKNYAAKRIQYVSVEFGINATIDKSRSAPSAILAFPDGFHIYSRLLLSSTASDSFFCKDITEIPVMQVPFRAGMVVPKNSPFKEFFNHRIINLYESGLLYREQTHYVNTYKPICDPTYSKTILDSDSDPGLSVHDTFTAFLIIISGFLISFMVLSLEKFISFAGGAAST